MTIISLQRKSIINRFVICKLESSHKTFFSAQISPLFFRESFPHKIFLWFSQFEKTFLDPRQCARGCSSRSRWSRYRVWNETEVDCGTTSVGISKRNRRQRSWKQKKNTSERASRAAMPKRAMEKKKEVEHVKLSRSWETLFPNFFFCAKAPWSLQFCTLHAVCCCAGLEFSNERKSDLDLVLPSFKHELATSAIMWLNTAHTARIPRETGKKTIFSPFGRIHDINFIHKHYVDSHSHFGLSFARTGPLRRLKLSHPPPHDYIVCI